MFAAFPFILIAVLFYNLADFGALAAGQPGMNALLAQKFTLPLFSGDSWNVTVSDLFLTFTLILLFIETVKAARNTTRATLNHVLSILTFLAALGEFLLLKGFGTSTFFLITAMTLFDVVAGYALAIVATQAEPEMPSHDYDD